MVHCETSLLVYNRRWYTYHRALQTTPSDQIFVNAKDDISIIMSEFSSSAVSRYPRKDHLQSWLHSWVEGGSIAGASGEDLFLLYNQLVFPVQPILMYSIVVKPLFTTGTRKSATTRVDMPMSPIDFPYREIPYSVSIA